MQINKSKRFNDELETILDFIAMDNFKEALKFLDELEQKIDNIKSMPYIYRKSKKANNKNIRDMTYKKYVIPYQIKECEIIILGIFNQNLWEIKN